MSKYANYIILGSLFVICFLGALHASHDGDKELLAFALDSGKEILAAILTITTVTIATRRSTDQNGTPAASTNEKEKA